MIAGTYLGAAFVVAVLGVLLTTGDLTKWSFMALVLGAFFLASAGASSAYLTVSEIFPMETRALAIALFYAVGTAVGGITGPLLFGQFIHSGSIDQVATGFFIGAAAMALGGVAELLFGVRAEGRSLEDIATPLTAEEGEAELAGRLPEAAPTGQQQRARDRASRRRERGRRGARRFAPGPGSGSRFPSPGMLGTASTASRFEAMAEEELDREINAIVTAVTESGSTDTRVLARHAKAHEWGPGRFGAALREAEREGRISPRGPGTVQGGRPRSGH